MNVLWGQAQQLELLAAGINGIGAAGASIIGFAKSGGRSRVKAELDALPGLASPETLVAPPLQ